MDKSFFLKLKNYFSKPEFRYFLRIEKKHFFKLGPIIFCLVFLPPLLNDTYITHLLIVSLLFGAFSVSFDLGAGFLGIANFGFSGFVGLGAYFSALSATRLFISPWLGLLIAGAVSAVLGLFVGFVTLRLQGIYLAVFAWLLAETLKFLIANLVEITRGYMGLLVPSFPQVDLGFSQIDFGALNRLPVYYLMLVLFFIVYGVSYLTIKSKIGLAWRAIKQDEVEASVIGVNVLKYKVINFAFSCFLAGLLGSFYAHYIGILTPDILGIAITVEVLTYVYVGGRGTLWGGVLASFMFVFLMELIRPLMVWRFVIYGALLVITLILFPNGISTLSIRFLTRALRKRTTKIIIH